MENRDMRHPLKRVAAKVGAVTAVIGGAVSTAATIGAISADQSTAVQGTLTAVSVLATALAALAAAFGVRSAGEPLVTPVADPRADDGTPLIPGARA